MGGGGRGWQTRRGRCTERKTFQLVLRPMSPAHSVSSGKCRNEKKGLVICSKPHFYPGVAMGRPLTGIMVGVCNTNDNELEVNYTPF